MAQRWIQYCRVTRGQSLSLKAREFVISAKSLGASDAQIIARHIIPNLIQVSLVIGTFAMASSIISEASLSFLGLGVPPEIPTWGTMLADGRIYISTAWWLALFPGPVHLRHGAGHQPAGRRPAGRPGPEAQAGGNLHLTPLTDATPGMAAPRRRNPLNVRFFYGWVVVATTFVASLMAAGIRAAPQTFVRPLEADFGLEPRRHQRRGIHQPGALRRHRPVRRALPGPSRARGW